MKEFLKRVATSIACVAVFILAVIFMAWIVMLLDKGSVVVEFIVHWFIMLPIGIGAVLVILSFLHWLLIEPFKKVK